MREEGHPLGSELEARETEPEQDGEITLDAAMWRDVKARLRENIGTRRFDLWFARTQLLRSSDGEICVGVANAVVQQFLEERYRDILEKIASELAGRRIEVSFRISTELYRDFRREREIRMQNAEAVRKSQETTLQKETNGEEDASDKTDAQAARRMRLEDYIVGDCNRMAYAACLEVAGLRCPRFNVLYIHGASGLGKTHLLKGIREAIESAGNGRHVTYATAESWTNEFFGGLRGGKDLMEKFRRRYRGCDALLIDDADFFGNKATTQGEFCHTFNAVTDRGGLVVLAANAAPEDVPKLNANLGSRILAGLIIKVDAPDYETRLAILRAKAEGMGLDCDEEALEIIAGQCRENVRQLEGALHSVRAYAEMEGIGEAGAELARRALRGCGGGARVVAPKTTSAHIEQAVTERFGISRSDLHSKRRVRTIARYRHLCMYLMRRTTDESLEQIGAYFNRNNHSTVRHAVAKMEEEIAEDPALREFVEEFLKRCGEG